MNLNNILLIVSGVIGLGCSLVMLTVAALMLVLHPGVTDPVRLKWSTIVLFLYLSITL